MEIACAIFMVYSADYIVKSFYCMVYTDKSMVTFALYHIITDLSKVSQSNY